MNNFHTHTKRCGHATGTEEEYIAEALNNGFTELGFSDHGPDPKNFFGYRMEWSELDDYIETVSMLKKKYADKIDIFTGFEYEYTEGMEKSFLRYVHENPLVDYFALGLHFFTNDSDEIISSFNVKDPHDFKNYSRLFERACESGLYSFFAHPDVIFMGLTEHSRYADAAIDAIVKTAIEHDMPLEMNANGMRRPLVTMDNGAERFAYPYRPFWDKAADMGARIIIGSDCHSVRHLNDEMFKHAYELAKEWGITVDPLTGDDLK